MTDAKDEPKAAAPKGAAAKKAVAPKKAAAEASPVPPQPPFPDLGRADGPWTFEDAPETQAFVSFGSLKVPAFPTLFARVEIDPKTKQAGAVSILVDDCSVQLQVLAGPRGGGLWGDVRRAITERVRRVGGRTQVVEGTFGPELIVNLPAPLAGGLVGIYTRRFFGVDGERWMIRASVGGPSALTDATVAKVDALVSRCAVERGDDVIVSGRVMALAFPTGQGAAVAEGAEKGAARPGFFVEDILEVEAAQDPGWADE